MPYGMPESAAQIYQGLTGGVDPIVSGVQRAVQMLATKQQREQALKQQQFEDQLQAQAGQRAQDAATMAAHNNDLQRQLQILALKQKATATQLGKREKIPFEERAQAGEEAAQIPDTPENRAAWEAKAPTRLKAPELFQVHDSATGVTHDVPLLTQSHLAELQAKAAAEAKKAAHQAALENQEIVPVTDEMRATLEARQPGLGKALPNEISTADYMR
jgi:hypothetical protein